MANAKKQKTQPIDPEKLKQERASLVQTIGDESYAVEIYKANILMRCKRINEINQSLRSLEIPAPKQAQQPQT